MDTELIALMQRLSAELRNVPFEIEAAKADKRMAEDVVAAADAMIDGITATLALGVTGGNEFQRKHALEQAKFESVQFQKEARRRQEAAGEVARLHALVERLEHEFQAVGYQANMLASLLNAMSAAHAPAITSAVEFDKLGDVMFQRTPRTVSEAPAVAEISPLLAAETLGL